MKIKVLDRAAMGYDLSFEKLRNFGEVEIYDSTRADELAERVSDADILILNKIKITKEILLRSEKLKLICVFATGFDNIDVEGAKEMGIAVCNVPAYSTDSVALFTVANVLSIYTHLPEYSRHVSSGRYTAEGKANSLIPVYHEMRGKVWGIIGFGNIGRAVAKIAEAMGARVVVNKRVPVDDYECVDIDTLCEVSDIITIHCPLNEQTRGLINYEKIEKMKIGVVLVNEARGAVLDEEAVANAILLGKIGAFGSDVYSVEPFDEKHPFASLLELDNVCLTPHAAWGAYEARVRCLDIICDNIDSFLCQKTLNRVDITRQN